MYASTKSGKKFEAETGRNGSYSFKVTHSGSFTLTAKDPNGNYKKSDAKTVQTTQASHTQNIRLEYGRTVEVTGRVSTFASATATSGTLQNGATVIVKVEGVEVARGETKTIRGRFGSYSFPTIAHNGGDITVTASYTGMRTISITHFNVGNKTTVGGGVGYIELYP